jgi:hypothetical protein
MRTASTIQVKQQSPGMAVLPPGLDVREPDTFSDYTWLWLDVPKFRVWSIIRNNYPAVRDNMRRAGVDEDTLENAVALYSLINMMDQEEQAEVLTVPWLFGKDNIADEAVERLKNGTLTGPHAKIFPLVVGLLGLVNAAIAIDDGAQAKEAAEEVARMKEAEAMNAKLARDARWARIKPWLIPGGIVLALITILLILRLRK